MAKQTHKESYKAVFIRNDDSYESIIKFVAKDLKQNTIVPLLGAGISIDSPSNLYLAKELVCPLVYALRTCTEFALKDIKPRANDLTPAKRVFKSIRLERLLDALHQTHGLAALNYLSVLNESSWNYNHASISALAEHKYLTRCITLNFDLLIEKAIAARNLSSKTECPLTNQLFDYGKGLKSLHILKPHGSFTPTHISADPFENLSATLSQVGSRPARENMEAFQRILLDRSTLFVAG